MAEFGYLHRDTISFVICKQSAVSYPLHNHVSVFTLGFLLEGAVQLTTDRGSRLYRKDDAFLILPYVPHSINARSRYTMISLCLSADWAVRAEAGAVDSAAASLLREAVSRPELEESILRALRGFLPAARMTPLGKETAVSRLKAQLELYPERRYSLDDMSRIAFISKYELIRAFKNEVGLTPHQFQIQNRIRKAQRLLEKNAAIAEAASAAGFCDQSHFDRHFKKRLGLTPADYRLACDPALPLSVD